MVFQLWRSFYFIPPLRWYAMGMISCNRILDYNVSSGHMLLGISIHLLDFYPQSFHNIFTVDIKCLPGAYVYILRCFVWICFSVSKTTTLKIEITLRASVQSVARCTVDCSSMLEEKIPLTSYAYNVYSYAHLYIHISIVKSAVLRSTIHINSVSFPSNMALVFNSKL